MFETRYLLDAEIEIRDVGGVSNIHGYAARWEQVSEDLGNFHEVLNAKPFGDYLASRKADVVAAINHDRAGLPLARFTNGRGSLKLEEDNTGLHMNFDAPNTSAGRDLVESIKRGDMRGMSFAFQATDESWTERYNRMPLRRVNKANLRDVSIVTHPAYPKTSVGVRSLNLDAVEATDRQLFGAGALLLLLGLPADDYNEALRKYPEVLKALGIIIPPLDLLAESRNRQLALLRRQLTDCL